MTNEHEPCYFDRHGRRCSEMLIVFLAELPLSDGRILNADL